MGCKRYAERERESRNSIAQSNVTELTKMGITVCRKGRVRARQTSTVVCSQEFSEHDATEYVRQPKAFSLVSEALSGLPIASSGKESKNGQKRSKHGQSVLVRSARE